MANETQPLATVLGELRALIGRKATGFLFIVTEDNHSASIRLRDGHIDEVNFRNRFNDDAVQFLAQVTGARARFQPGPVSPSKRPPLGESAMQWLLGRRDNPGAAPAPSAATSASAEAAPTLAQLRPAIEKVALNYLGPIASLLCEEAFAGTDDVEQALRHIALNLPERDEADRFINEARAALAKKP